MTPSGTAKLVFEASEVADFCSTDVATIYTWVKKGEITFFKTPGGRLRFKREAVLDFLRRYHFPVPAELSVGRPRVAVLDDDAASLERTRRGLARAFDVDAHGDPCEALLSIGHAKPDAIVLDTRFGGLDGLHLVRALRAWPELPHTRIVVFSSREEDQQACLDAGAAGFVPRHSVEDLAAKLRHLLGAR